MDFFTAVEKRRSIRKFSDEAVPAEVMRKAFEAAVRAPNSSNTQTWHFHWIRSAEKKAAVAQICLNQSAARTAQELVVISADPRFWKRSHAGLIQWIETANAPKPVHLYYKTLIPSLYRTGPFNLFAPFKWLLFTLAGLTRPMQRGPATHAELTEVAVKSAALAAENFVLAISAQGYDTCMMEGFDRWRLRRLLGLPRSERILMVVAVGREGERATWGPQMRLPLEQVVREV